MAYDMLKVTPISVEELEGDKYVYHDKFVPLPPITQNAPYISTVNIRQALQFKYRFTYWHELRNNNPIYNNAAYPNA